MAAQSASRHRLTFTIPGHIHTPTTATATQGDSQLHWSSQGEVPCSRRPRHNLEEPGIEPASLRPYSDYEGPESAPILREGRGGGVGGGGTMSVTQAGGRQARSRNVNSTFSQSSQSVRQRDPGSCGPSLSFPVSVRSTRETNRSPASAKDSRLTCWEFTSTLNSLPPQPPTPLSHVDFVLAKNAQPGPFNLAP